MTLNRDVQAEVDKMTKIIKDMSDSIRVAIQEKVKAMEVTNTAQ